MGWRIARVILLIAPLSIGSAFAACGNDRPPPAGYGGPIRDDAGASDDAASMESDPITDFSVGGTAACVVRASGRVYCWGSNQQQELGFDGGDGTCDGPCLSKPTLRADLPEATRVVVGGTSACAIAKADSALWCWGSLGGLPVSLPKKVLPKVRDVSVGTGVACAIADGVSTTEVWCWGSNAYGLLGEPADSTIRREAPQRHPQLDGARAVRVAQTEFACVITSDSGVACWGWNVGGFLGHAPIDGGTTEVCLDYGCEHVPSKIAGLTVDRLTVGRAFACARRLDGKIACWGSNRFSELAISPDTDNHPIPIDLALLDVTDVSALYHHACARTKNGQVHCWGRNETSESRSARQGVPCSANLFNEPSSICVPTPTLVEGIEAADRIGAGQFLTLAMKGNGAGWGWGYNAYGTLGHAPRTNGDGTSSIECGTRGTCALRPVAFALP